MVVRAVVAEAGSNDSSWPQTVNMWMASREPTWRSVRKPAASSCVCTLTHARVSINDWAGRSA